MAVKGRSARGVIVDFDLLKIKEQMTSSPPSIDVRKRQDFVENRLRRRARKKVPQEMLDNIIAPVDVDPEMPSTEGDTANMIDAVANPVEVVDVVEPEQELTEVSKTSKQKARPKNKIIK